MSGKDLQMTNVIRCLAVDTVQSANSGHPGAPMGMAPISNVLFSEFLKFDPKEPNWHDRDRFVLSNGHASALIYTMLHLCGYDLPLGELKKFRQLHSKTPGHPERHVTPGVEVTTGPLGQGISNSVGLAIAEAHLAATFNRAGHAKVVDHFTYAFCGDGCLMEGVAQESISLAGHLGLEKLVVIYDDNKITIDGATDIAFTEKTEDKMRSMGWHTIRVENGDSDFGAMRAALEEARAVRGKPKIILLRTTIGYGSKLQGTEKVHGAPLGAAEIKRVKEAVFHRDPNLAFHVEPEAYQHFGAAGARGAATRAAWNLNFAKYEAAFPELAQKYKKFFSGKIDAAALFAKLPKNGDKPLATRKSSENAMAVIFNEIPNLVGGSADLTHSNLTRPGSVKLTDFQKASPEGRIIRFGVREHGMAAIMNGIDAHGGLIAFGATFMNFIGYALGAVRLSAMSEHGVVYVATHDSIGLGEDGPTHQPVELATVLRALPHMQTFRPADQTETSAAWAISIASRNAPSILCLSRHNVPSIEGASFEGVRAGAYVVSKDAKKADVVIIGAGTELQIAVQGAKLLRSKGLSVQVVSMPCAQLFDAQPDAYRKSVLLPGTPVLSVEAYLAYGWERYSHLHVGMPGFGASAPDAVLYKHFGITPENVATKAAALIAYFKGKEAPSHMITAKL
jgi:transketolase